MSWATKFRDPITLPDGTRFVTLRDAADYCTKLPKRESEKPEWQQAIGLLMKACEVGGLYVDMARIAVLTAAGA
jgi:hypothetical protein